MAWQPSTCRPALLTTNPEAAVLSGHEHDLRDLRTSEPYDSQLARGHKRPVRACERPYDATIKRLDAVGTDHSTREGRSGDLNRIACIQEHRATLSRRRVCRSHEEAISRSKGEGDGENQRDRPRKPHE